MEHFEIAVIGSGPGGMSAAAHAAQLGVSHVLLEASPKHSNTIQKYQKGKHVMDTPNKQIIPVFFHRHGFGPPKGIFRLNFSLFMVRSLSFGSYFRD